MAKLTCVIKGEFGASIFINLGAENTQLLEFNSMNPLIWKATFSSQFFTIQCVFQHEKSVSLKNRADFYLL